MLRVDRSRFGPAGSGSKEQFVKRPRLLLADDHTLVLEGFRRILEADFDLVGLVEDGRALVKQAEQLKPDVIMLDISMPLLNGFEAARQIKKILPKTKLVFLTMHADTSYVTEALQVGASGYLLKRSPPSEVVEAIRHVLLGRVFITPLVLKDTLASLMELSKRFEAPAHLLTGRQREILQLTAEGHSSKDIAEALHVSVKTIEFHKSNIRRQLGVRTSADLVKYAVRHRIVEP
jgi:DNA-binding NarL/FixJ family response regulator